MDIHITSDGEIIDINYSNCFVKVDKNYVYEDKDLINNINYKQLLDYAIKINNNKKYLDNIDDSHDVVALYMILMNHEVGKYLSSHKSGIYRDVKYVDVNLESINVSNTLRKFLNIYNNVEANYKLYELDIEHQLIGKGVDYYTQVTSPIRRIVDLINIILLQKYGGLIETNDSINNFIDKWLKSIQTINNDMKSIRKVQNDCNLLNECIVNNKQQSYEGYIIKFDKNYDNYSVYLPSIKLLTYIKSNDKLEIYKKYLFTIHVFNDEYTLKQKVRLQMIY